LAKRPVLVRHHLEELGVRNFEVSTIKRLPAYPNYRFILPPVTPKVSIIIPTRNSSELLRRCINSIREVNSYCNYEIIIVDNLSDDSDAINYMFGLSDSSDCRYLRDDNEFNFSSLVNIGASAASGDFLLLLNNDIEFVYYCPDALVQMVGLATNFSLAVVGAKLLYPSGSIVQHSSLVLGLGGIAGDRNKFHDHEFDNGYFDNLHLNHLASAVTGACMLVRRDVYSSIGGFDASLPVAFNDVDFCMRVSDSWHHVGQCSEALLAHWESKSRGLDDLCPLRAERLIRESKFMMDRWGDRLFNDPFYNPNLTLERDDDSPRYSPKF
jgi:GT2 family glycosyltransferase